MDKAAFSLESYSFDRVMIDYTLKTGNEIRIKFDPSGVFEVKENQSVYNLNFVFYAFSETQNDPFVKIECNAIFDFAEKISFEEIPPFFYANSIAIIFPYVRAFISTVTLQANFSPLVLPTMNLSALEQPLRENTIAK